MIEGQTTEQLRNAPENAMFICAGPCRSYALSLSYAIGRGDLRIVTSAWLDKINRPRARNIVVDHAAQLNHRQRDNLDRMQAHD